MQAAQVGTASPLRAALGTLSARISIGERPVTVGDIAEVLGCPRRIVLPVGAPGDEGCDYRLIEVIGAGGMGRVYAARQTAMQRIVALKRMPHERRGTASDEASFLLEAMITAKLDHPNIIPIHDMGRDQHDLIFYTMRRVRGRPWSESLASLGLEENVEVLIDVCDAVAYAHTRGLIHRDLKPENIMLGDFGEVQVTDWGLAIDLPGLRDGAMGPRIACGTPAYMAPEMADDDRARIGPASDVYLLGGVLCQLLTGQPPHPGETALAALEAAEINRIVPGLPDDELGAIARHALATDPADRQDGVKEFQQALRDWRMHVQSGRLVVEAEGLAERAARAPGYQLFSRAVHTYEEALVLWPGNQRAASSLTEVRLRYAEQALAAGDLDLATAQAEGDAPECAALRVRIAEVRRQRHEHALHVRTLTRLSALLLALLILVLAGGLLLSDHQRRLVLTATHARDRAEAQLAHAEGQRQKQDNRIWEPVLREDFTTDVLPSELRVVSGAWSVGRGQLLATGTGTSQLALSTDAIGDLRIRFDRATTEPLSIYLGVAARDLPLRSATAAAPMVRLDHQCHLYRGLRELAVIDLPPRVAGLTPRIAIERDGRMIHVQIDGRPLLGADAGAFSEPLDPRVVIAADEGTALEDLRVEILHTVPTTARTAPPHPHDLQVARRDRAPATPAPAEADALRARPRLRMALASYSLGAFVHRWPSRPAAVGRFQRRCLHHRPRLLRPPLDHQPAHREVVV